MNYADDRILWLHVDGRISLWEVDDKCDQISYREYGPIAGWTPINYSEGKVLWHHADGRISLWTVASRASDLPNIPGWPGWDDDSYYPPGTKPHKPPWRPPQKPHYKWISEVKAKEHGPFPDWMPINYANNTILWRDAEGCISLWLVDHFENTQLSYKEYGPFPGWMPLNCTGNRVLWRG